MMKKIIILIALAIAFKIDAQVNLVPNPSFESYTACPDNWAQIVRATDWVACGGSPDYFNSCSATPGFSTPTNEIGKQVPASGNAYAGLIVYSKSGGPANELIMAPLTETLSIGTKYFVSFKLVLKYNNPYSICCACNKIGAKVSTSPFSLSNPPAMNNIAHVYTNMIISDTLNWSRVFGAFIADSAYKFLTIGRFFTNANVSITDFIPSNDASYYFVDDVCLSQDSVYCSNYSYNVGLTDVSFRDDIELFPNPFDNRFTLKMPESIPYDLELFNNLGQLIYQEKTIYSIQKIINLEHLPKGIFYLRLTTKNSKVLYYKLLKLKE